MRREEFDPEDIRQSDMNEIADAIEEYKSILESVMVIPDSIMKECKKDLEEALRRTEKLIKKLRKGDKDIFVDEINEEII